MSRSEDYFRVKVFVDGRWVSTGDFYDLEQAKDRAKLIAVLLQRRVEIQNAGGLVVHREDLDGDAPSSDSRDKASRDTAVLD